MDKIIVEKCDVNKCGFGLQIMINLSCGLRIETYVRIDNDMHTEEEWQQTIDGTNHLQHYAITLNEDDCFEIDESDWAKIWIPRLMIATELALSLGLRPPCDYIK
jgi:hypothetical protein